VSLDGGSSSPPSGVTSARRLSGPVVVILGLAAGQLTAYALNVIAARRLGPDNYGILAALLAVILISNTVGVGVQTASARRLASGDPVFRASAGRTLLTFGARSGLVVAAVVLLATPILASALHIEQWWSLVLVAIAMVPMTAVGAQLGLAQGHEDFVRVGGIYAVANSSRSLVAIVGAVAGASVTATITGLLIGAVIGWGAGYLVVAPLVGPSPRVKISGLGAETARTSHALIALFILTNLDILLARHFLPPTLAGEYAVGVVIAKIAFFLPQVVTVVVFPRLARERDPRSLSLAVLATLGLGVVLTLGVALFASQVVNAAGGSAYQGLIGQAWMFAALGTVFAVVQICLFGRFAAEDRRSVVGLWATVAILGIAVTLGPHDTVTVIVGTALIVGTTLSVVAYVSALRLLRQSRHLGSAAKAGSGHGPGE